MLQAIRACRIHYSAQSDATAAAWLSQPLGTEVCKLIAAFDDVVAAAGRVAGNENSSNVALGPTCCGGLHRQGERWRMPVLLQPDAGKRRALRTHPAARPARRPRRQRRRRRWRRCWRRPRRHCRLVPQQPAALCRPRVWPRCSPNWRPLLVTASTTEDLGHEQESSTHASRHWV